VVTPTPAKKRKTRSQAGALKAKKAKTNKKSTRSKKAQEPIDVNEEDAKDEEEDAFAAGSEIVGTGYATPELPIRGGSAEPASTVNSSPSKDPYRGSVNNHVVRQPTRLDGRLYGSLSRADKRAVIKLYSKEFHERKVSGADVRAHSRVLSTPAPDGSGSPSGRSPANVRSQGGSDDSARRANAGRQARAETISSEDEDEDDSVVE
jgi:hypothetical protein